MPLSLFGVPYGALIGGQAPLAPLGLHSLAAWQRCRAMRATGHEQPALWLGWLRFGFGWLVWLGFGWIFHRILIGFGLDFGWMLASARFGLSLVWFDSDLP